MKYADHNTRRPYCSCNIADGIGKLNNQLKWMGRPQIKVAECNYKHNNILLKEKFINGIYDNIITNEIIR